jgi:hypothetical protein
MKYRIELAAAARADIRQQTQWLRDQESTVFFGLLGRGF